MFAPRQHENNLLFGLRWAARMLSAVSIGSILLLILSDGFNLSRVTWEEMGVLLLFPLGLLVGLILGWEEEAKGGALAVLSVTSFYLAYGLLLKGSFSEGLWILFFLIPGFLLLLYGALLSIRGSKTAAG